MNQIEVVLISGRTTDQGASLEVGKTSEQYFKSVTFIEMSTADADTLELEDGDPVEVSTPHGSVVVLTRRSEGLDKGLIFFPYGPWANQVFGANTGGTGMPSFKGVRAKVKPVEGAPLTLSELVEGLRGEG